MTDPSYARQLITFTYPHIGNYGVCADAMESDRIHARGAIMRDARNHEDHASAEGGWLDWLRDCGVPAITGVDTRALVRHIRDAGSMRGGIFPADCAEQDAAAAIVAEPIAVIDTGVKTSIVANLRSRGARLQLHPCTTSADQILGCAPDAVMLVNGPGDPAALGYLVEQVRALVGRLPIFGICLGHQLVCRAVGLETYKLRFGHRGANHPVKDLQTGRIDITSQNHGFAVLGPGGERTIAGDEPVRWDTDFGAAELTHLNLYDRTVEGLRLPDAGASISSTGSSARSAPDAAPRGHPPDHDPRLGPDRHRAGSRVRLLGSTGLQGPRGRGLRGGARQLEPGDDHDRPRVRDRDLHRAAAARAGRADHRARAAGRAAPDARRSDGAEPRQGAA
jgi:carbamoyl-phosphate synthase small subunit